MVAFKNQLRYSRERARQSTSVGFLRLPPALKDRQRVLEGLDLRVPALHLLLPGHAGVDARRAQRFERLQRHVEELLVVLQPMFFLTFILTFG